MQELTMSEIKMMSLDILKDIKRVCEELHLTYFLDSGTLLGAIRHNGFIPWDDDIDIVMPRPDYDRFCKEYNKFSNSNYYVSSLENSKNYFFSFAKVYDRRTKKIEHGTYLLKQGLCLDIFPLDGYPDSVREHYDNCVNVFNKYASAVGYAFVQHYKFNPLKLLQNIILFLFRHFIVRKCALSVHEFASSIDYDSSEYVGCNSIMYYNQKNCRAMKKSVFTPMMHQFEDDYFIIPAGYDEVLTKYYGSDYMTPPPEDKRTSSHGVNIYLK